MNRFCRISLLLAYGVLLAACPLTAKDNSVRSLQNAYAAVAQKAFPAVVVVAKYKYTGRTFVRVGAGSGFVVRPDGYITTNYHVIKGADAIAVKLPEQPPVAAAIIGADPDIDLAVLKIQTAKRLPCLQFADTAKVKVGHYAIAIGAPFSLAHTMTTGIVSHKGRKLNGGYYEDYIQTDASINPGNSGGPLLDIDGKVIGVNSSILSPGDGGNVGIGFAIDGNLARKRINAMIRSSSKNRPSAGMGLVDTQPPGKGARVSRILKRSPAEKSGLRPGDVIVKIDDRSVVNMHDVQSVILNYYKPGDTADLVFIRSGKKLKTKLRFE